MLKVDGKFGNFRMNYPDGITANVTRKDIPKVYPRVPNAEHGFVAPFAKFPAGLLKGVHTFTLFGKIGAGPVTADNSLRPYGGAGTRNGGNAGATVCLCDGKQCPCTDEALAKAGAY